MFHVHVLGPNGKPDVPRETLERVFNSQRSEIGVWTALGLYFAPAAGMPIAAAAGLLETSPETVHFDTTLCRACRAHRGGH